MKRRSPSLAQAINERRAAAWSYERLWRPFALWLFSGEPFAYRRELLLLAALMQPQRGGLYVDVGCSGGLYARALSRAMGTARGRVMGIDRALPMLLDARHRARRAGLIISYVCAEAQALPLATNAAAGVAVGGSLNEIGDLDGSLAEIARVLAPDARLVTMTLTTASTRAGRLMQRLLGLVGIQFWSADELLRCFEHHGLRSCGCWQYGVVAFTQSVK